MGGSDSLDEAQITPLVDEMGTVHAWLCHLALSWDLSLERS